MCRAVIAGFAITPPEVTFATVAMVLRMITAIQVSNQNLFIKWFWLNLDENDYSVNSSGFVLALIYIMVPVDFTDTDECAISRSCQNGGTCIDKPGYSICECDSRQGVTGRYCEQGEIKNQQLRTFVTLNIFLFIQCKCDMVFLSDVQECSLGITACQRNSTCTNTLGSFNCTCAKTDKGEFCQNG